MQSLEFDGLRVEIFTPHAPFFAPAPSFTKEAVSAPPIIYLHALEFSAASVGEIYELVSRGADFVLAAIYLNEAQWGDKLSPWVAKSPFKGVRDFAGGGAAHLEKFTNELIPRIERHVFGAGRPAWDTRWQGFLARTRRLRAINFKRSPAFRRRFGLAALMSSSPHTRRKGGWRTSTRPWARPR